MQLAGIFYKTSGLGNRYFRKWLNTIFNKVDYERIKDVGADRAAAEWLLRCGASVKWHSKKEWVSDYNSLTEEFIGLDVIEEIDATESCIMNVGFHYLSGLKNLKSIKFRKCMYLEDRCMFKLSVTKNSLQCLEVVSCGNVTDKGILSITELINLKKLLLYDLPEVKHKEECLSALRNKLPECEINFPSVLNT